MSDVVGLVRLVWGVLRSRLDAVRLATAWARFRRRRWAVVGVEAVIA
jgi:hypothetical protein